MRNVLRLACCAALLGCSVPSHGQAAASDPEVSRGVQQVQEGDFTGAIRTLGAVVQRLKDRGGPTADLTRGYSYLGMAQLTVKREAEARAAFIAGLTADPKLRLSLAEFPPKVVEFFEEVRAQFLAANPSPSPTPTPEPDGKMAMVLIEAVKQGDFAAVRQLLAEYPRLINAKDSEFGATCLHWGALRARQSIVALLIAQGADVNVKNRAGETPLQVAERAKQVEIARLLKSAGAVAGPPTGAAPPPGPGAPPAPSGANVWEAAKTNDVEGLKKLLAQTPTSLSQPDTAFGATPLHYAALRGSVEAVKLLVEQGADLNAKNKEDETPLKVAVRSKQTTVLALLQQLTNDTSAVIEAAKRGDMATLRRLVPANPKPLLAAKDAQFGATPLHWASMRGQAEAAEYLVAQGADPKAKNGAGETPLQVAERNGRTEVVRVLSKSGS